MATDLNSSTLGTRSRTGNRPTIGGEHDATIIVRMPGELRLEVEKAAGAEFLPIAVWMRRAVRAELRRKVKP